MHELLRSDLVIAIISFSLAVSISLRKERDKQHTLLSLFLFFAALIFLLKHLFYETSTHIWLRLCIGFLISIPLVLLFLISAFLRDENNLSIELYTIQYIFAPILIVGLSTPIFNNREFVWFSISYSLGMLSFIFFNLLYLGYKEENLSQKKRIIIFSLLGILLVTSSILALKINDSTFWIGINSVLILLFLYYITESVLNGKLLDLREFISKILILVIVSVLISILYWIFVVLITYKPIDMIVNSLAVSISIVLMFDGLRQLITSIISHYITARRRDFTTKIKKIRKEISSIIDAEKLLKRVVDEVFASQRVNNCAFFVLSEERTYYQVYYSLGQQVPERIDNILDHSLIEMLNEQKQIIVREIIEKRHTHDSTVLEEGGPQSKLRDVLNSLIRLNISIICPIFIDNEMHYLLTINDADVPEPINAEELGELIELCEQVAVSLQNLKIFERIKERDRLAAIGEMAAGLAHEIRNPLSAIKGAAQYLNPSNLPPEEAEFLKIIIEETDRLNKVLTQFLDYSRPYHAELSTLNLDSILKQIIKLFSSEKYSIEYANLAQDAIVKIDAEQFKQVIINILKNAQEAMPDGGKIEIKVFNESHLGKRILSTVLLRERERLTKVFIEIKDRGVGIDEKDLKKVFIPFFTTKKSGTGLGLAISKKIIESHNGKLEIFSRLGEGTTVRIVLPSSQMESPR
ncbi:MAG: ATP-binding protein [Deltaproteobacteria bacterium]|nr:ATP-binding protein [Deltaproteobacteria bacterium]